MKRSVWVRLLAVILVISMLAAPVSAATARGPEYGTNGLVGSIIEIIRDIIRDIFDDWFDGPGDEPTEPTVPAEPTEPPVPTTPEEPTAPSEPVETDPTEPSAPVETDPTEPSEPGETTETVLNLIEGHANTENGYLLRGVTYSLSQTVAQPQPQGAPYALRSGLSTLSLNNKTQMQTMAVSSGLQTMAETTTYERVTISFDDSGKALIPDGDYLIHLVSDSCASYITTTTNSSSPWNTTVLNGTIDQSAAGVFTFTKQSDGTYTVQGPGKWYMTIDANNSAQMQSAVNYLEITAHTDGSSILLKDVDSNIYMNGLGADYYFSHGEYYYGGYSSGSPFELYAVTTTETPDEPEEETKLVYFPVTMFNYKDETVNAITHAMDIAKEPDAATWNGFYFSAGNPGNASFTAQTGTSTVNKTVVTYELVVPTYNSSGYINNLETDAEYILVNKRANAAVVTGNPLSQSAAIANVGSDEITASFNEGETVTEIGGATLWTFSSGTSSRYVSNSDGQYMRITSGSSAVQSSQVQTYIEQFGDTNCVTLRQGTWTNYKYYLNDYDADNGTTFAGYSTATDEGNAFYIYKKVSTETVTETVPGTQTYTKGFAEWNKWSYGVYNSAGVGTAQNKFYTGLVENTLDENNNIVFKVNEPGIFTYGELTNNSDGTKNVYEYVGLPFVKNDKGYYTFDSDANGVHFPASDSWTTVPASGSGDKTSEDFMYNMTFVEGTPQTWSGLAGSYGDGSSNLWAPFDTPTDISTNKSDGVDYHFGMKAHIPFSMTPNGRVKSIDDESDPITFTFAGDDDVWIFIDGQLVIDLGGIHNRLGATINFAENTVTYELPASNKSTQPLGSFTDSSFVFQKALFNEGTTAGLIDMDLQEFASDVNHTMSVFYLERGEGTSNCKIEFNLPMLDTVTVTKDATKSWSQAQDDADGDSGDGTALLTASEQAAVDQIPFTFILYKKTADSEEFVPVVNTKYYLLDKNGNVISDTNSTKADGTFTLKNGQSAKFMTDIPGEGVTYYVQELGLDLDTFLTPDYKYAGEATLGFSYTDVQGVFQDAIANAATIPEYELPLDATVLASQEITAKGSIEAIDSLQFICTNYLNEELPSPTARAYEDIIVIDYGLPVHIDPLANDLFRGDTIEIVAWGDESLVLNEVFDENTKFSTEETTWAGTQTFHSGTVEFLDNETAENMAKYGHDTFTYTLNKQLTEVEVISYIVKVTSTVNQEIGDQIETKTAYDYALGKVYIVPATIMYYEENFSDMILFEGTGWDASSTVTASANVSEFQEDGVVGNSDNSTYGSDKAYEKDYADSNGTMRFGDTGTKAIRFTYTFTGTGSTIFARSTDKTGYMQVKVFAIEEDGSETLQDFTYRDTYYKDENTTDLDQTNTLYNIPVYSTDENLPYGTYKVVCTVAKAGTPTDNPTLDEDGNPVLDEKGNVVPRGSGSEFYLDGIRILRPLEIVVDEEAVYDEETGELVSDTVYDTLTTKALDAYNDDGESNLDVVTLRQKLITDAQVNEETGELYWDNVNFAMLTDINGAITTAEDYEGIGPKNEVYLAPGQTVSFSLKYWQPEGGLKLYMGMKAPFGLLDSANPDQGSAALNVGSKQFRLYNATDCYYDVTNNYANLTEAYEQLCDENGYLLYTDPTGREVYEDYDGNRFYSDDNTAVAEDIELTPVDDLDNPYYVVTYTFTATEGIVSLTNIKVVGNYEFTIVEDADIIIPGDEYPEDEEVIE